jgi:putative hydrolase of the HAD superfamily
MTVIRAVLFDFYGTLARWPDRDTSGYRDVFAQLGYALPMAVFERYIEQYDGVEHVEHSTDAATYEAWVRSRLGGLARDCGVPDESQEPLIDALRAADASEMVAYPESAATLEALQGRGLRLGVCSNWGWDLDTYLAQAGLLRLVDVAVTSAQAGARKPHPRVYAVSLAALGAQPSEVLFVGDSWGPDVIGPTRAGMTAVHVWRPDEKLEQQPPQLEGGVQRITDLGQLLDLFS